MNAAKREVIARYLEHGEIAVMVDGRQPGVCVPDELRQAHLILKLSYRYDPPDLALNDWGFSLTLGFNGNRSLVRVPWTAVHVARSAILDAGETWPEPDEPPTIAKWLGGLGLVQ